MDLADRVPVRLEIRPGTDTDPSGLRHGACCCGALRGDLLQEALLQALGSFDRPLSAPAPDQSPVSLRSSRLPSPIRRTLP